MWTGQVLDQVCHARLGGAAEEGEQWRGGDAGGCAGGIGGFAAVRVHTVPAQKRAHKVHSGGDLAGSER
jgi:hypothetical protein